MYKKRQDILISCSELAQRLEAEISGNTNLTIQGLSSLDSPKANTLCFVREFSSTSNKLLMAIENTAILCSSSHKGKISELPSNSYLYCGNANETFINAISLFYEPISIEASISPLASISKTAKIGNNVCIQPFAVVSDNCQIGDNCFIASHVVLYPNVTIGQSCTLHASVVVREDCVVGKHCTLHAGVVIGADGFGYIPDAKEGLKKVPQLGNVRISDFVEIGANTCIDRATLGSTVIGQSTKIDNLVQVGHNVKIGSYSIICGQVGLAGSAKIGDQVTLGGKVGVTGHCKIADKVRVGGSSTVISSLDQAGDYVGYPAQPARSWKLMSAAMRKLPSLLRQGNFTLAKNKKKLEVSDTEDLNNDES